MLPEEVLYETLTRDAGVAALVGSQIFPGVMPEGTTIPAGSAVLVYSVISGVPARSQSRLALINARVQIDVWASKFGDAAAAALAVIRALDRRIGEGLQSSQLISGPRDLRDPQTGEYRRVLEFSQWWEMAA